MKMLVGMGIVALAVCASPLRAERAGARHTPGLITGVVTDATDGRAVPNAVVSLMTEDSAAGRAPSGVRWQIANEHGRYAFRDLDAGTYVLRVTVGGTGYSVAGAIASGLGSQIGAYLAGGFGQTAPGGPLLPIPLLDGQQMIAADVRLWRGATLSGTVTDDLGEPVVNAVVGAAHIASDGSMIGGPSTWTDDLGRYRLSAIAPGNYVVFVPQTQTSLPASNIDDEIARQTRAGAPTASIRDRAQALAGIAVGASVIATAPANGNNALAPRRQGDHLLVYQTTFFPAATSLGTASSVTLAAGDERAGMDIVLAAVPAAAVSGRVLTSGAPAARMRVRMLPAGGPRSASMFETASTVTDESGAFRFPAVPAGSYTLYVLGLPQNQWPTTGAPFAIGTAGGPGAWATASIVVGDRDADDVVLALHAGLSVRGRHAFASAAPPAATIKNWQLRLQPVRPTTRAEQDAAAAASPADDGTFALVGAAPGRYVLKSSGTAPWTVESIVVAGKDVAGRAFDLTEDLSDIVVTWTDRAASVRGRVSAEQPSTVGASVLLFPAERSEWADGRLAPDRFVMVRAQANGDFTVPVILPGRYLAVAVRDADAAGFPDPEVLGALLRDASPLTVSPGQAASIDLAIKTTKGLGQ